MILEISFVIIFIVLVVFGFFIIYKQVSLIKKGEFSFKDRLLCLIYAIFFAMGVSVVIGMAIIFTLETPEFWENSTTPPPKFNPIFFLVPFFTCLIYISIYPIIDFLLIAMNLEHEKGFTPIHSFIEDKIINYSPNKSGRIAIAIFFYLGAFIGPPLILSLIGIPFIIIFVSWMLIYPLIILTYFGSRGYISGISNVYYHIPDIRRSIFLNFEDSKRGLKEFFSNPAPYIVFGMMIFVYIWAWISMIQTIVFFFIGKLAISTMSSYFVFITLFMGITGYFTRYFGRQIQSKGYHLLFAAYLMTAIGINVLVNFLIVNPEKLRGVFSLTSLTSPINPNYIYFAWAAIIEEVVLIIITTYYLLALNNEFIQNIRHAKIMACSQRFDPVPVFNLIKNQNFEIHDHARERLLLMFERIPLKSDINIDERRFKYSLLDGICDINPILRKTCFEILNKLKDALPDKILSWIQEAMNSPNYDKSLPLVQLLTNFKFNQIKDIPQEDIINMINDSEWQIKVIGLKLINNLISSNPELMQYMNVGNLLTNSNDQVQLEVLKLLEKVPLEISNSLILEKLTHPNFKIRVQVLKILQQYDSESIKPYIETRILPLLNDPVGVVRASAFDFFSKKAISLRLDLPLTPFFDGLTDSNELVRNASIFALETLFAKDPKSFDLNTIINKIDPNNENVLNTILLLLGKMWDKDPEKILLILLTFIKFENSQLKSNISKILISKYETHSELILKNFIKIPDDSKYVSKGIISKTLIQMAKKKPQETIIKLLQYLDSENEDVIVNAILTLQGLIEDYIDDIEITHILSVLKKDTNERIKKEGLKFLMDFVKSKPLKIKPSLETILEIMEGSDASVKISLSKALLEITKDSPQFVPMEPIYNLLDEKEVLVRESAAKILGYIGFQFPEDVVKILIEKALKDEDWIVRDAAVSSLGRLIDHVKKKDQIIETLILLLDDNENWVKRTVINILSNTPEISASKVPFNKIVNNLTSKDAKLRESSAGLLKIYGYENIDPIFDEIINLLGDESEAVRFKMITTMVEIIQKVGLSKLLSMLLKNMSDERTLETQRSIASILKRTAKYEEEKIKKRVIAVLKIRCEMSQDPVICEILQELREN